jgi:hypothetical protein
MYKKSLMFALMLFFILVFSLVNTNIVLAADITDSLGGAQDTLDNNVGKLEEVEGNITSKGEYLSQEWKKILLGNGFVSGVNDILTSISFIFVILLGQPYSFSLVFAFAIVFWVFFFFSLKKMFRIFSPFSPTVSLVVSICLTIALGQIGFYVLLSNLASKLALLPGSPLAAALIFIGIMVVLFFSSKILKFVYTGSEKNKEEIEKEKEKANRRALERFIERISGSSKY